MGGPIDHLQIGYSPKDHQRRPGCHRALAAPDLEQGYAMIDLRIPGEPRAADRAAVTLQAPQLSHVIAGRRPQLPGLDTAGMPGRISVRMAVVPQIAMPSEPEHRLSAYAAMSRILGVRFLAKRRGRRAKAERSRFPALDTPRPAFGRAAECRERARELVGADRMLAPIAFDCAPRRRRSERPGECMP